MNLPPQPVSAVQQLLNLGAPKVLLVEGPTDFAVYAIWLAKLAFPMAYRTAVPLVAAGGKIAVLNSLQWFADHGGEPRVFGLVDRDEWDLPAIAALRTKFPQLRVNSDRHALESYFCDPTEIWPALLAINPAWGSEQAAFQTAIDRVRTDYVQHWALLNITDRLKNRMIDVGYPGHFSATVPVPADADIQARLAQWSKTLDADVAFKEFDGLRGDALAATPNMQCRSHVWSKLFFECVVQPALSVLPSSPLKSALTWMSDLADSGPQVPVDVDAILRPLI